MIIYYNDESTLECSELEFWGNTIIADGIYSVNIEDIDTIVEGYREV